MIDFTRLFLGYLLAIGVFTVFAGTMLRLGVVDYTAGTGGERTNE